MTFHCCCCRCQYPDKEWPDPGGDPLVTEYEWFTNTTSESSTVEQDAIVGTTINCKGQLNKTAKPPSRHLFGQMNWDGIGMGGNRYDFARIYEDIVWQPDGSNACSIAFRCDYGTGLLLVGPSLLIRQGSQVAFFGSDVGDPRISELGPDVSGWRRIIIAGVDVEDPAVTTGGGFGGPLVDHGYWAKLPINPVTFAYDLWTPDVSASAPPIYFGVGTQLGASDGLGTGYVRQWDGWFDSLCIDLTVTP